MTADTQTPKPTKPPTPTAELALDQLTPEELVKRIKAENPGAMKRLGDKRVASLVESTLKALRAELDAVPERRVRMKEMGTFVVRQAEHPKSGKLVQRIGLSPAGREA